MHTKAQFDYKSARLTANFDEYVIIRPDGKSRKEKKVKPPVKYIRIILVCGDCADFFRLRPKV